MVSVRRTYVLLLVVALLVAIAAIQAGSASAFSAPDSGDATRSAVDRRASSTMPLAR